MNYKTELHCHTNAVSKCAGVPLDEMVEKYISLGYTTLVITDHFSPSTFEDMEDLSWEEKCNHFVSGYKKAKKIANGRINVILGMEFRNVYSSNDYLVYGVTEEFLKKYNLSDDNNFILMELSDFVRIIHENNMLIYQAHPFRNSMQIVNPQKLDGIEIANCHRRHDSRNDIAKMWAQKFNLMVCGGSDCHQRGDEARGGMITDFEIKTNDDLLTALKGNVQLLYPED